MRQMGLAPKSHKSGVYWTRAQLPEKRTKKPKKVQSNFSKYDINQNGKVDLWEITVSVCLGVFFVSIFVYYLLKLVI